MKTAHEIALSFSEKFQANYPAKPLWRMMEDLRIEIEEYASLRVSASERFRVEDAASAIAEANELRGKIAELTETNRQLVEALDNQYYFLLRIAGSQNLTDPARKEVNENIIAVQNLLSQFNKEEKV